MKQVDDSKTLQQLIPIGLTIVILGFLIAVLYFFVKILNQLPFGQPILLLIRPVDILVGFTIYLKTEIDFAIFMGRIMSTHPGWRNRVSLEIGSGLGNALGTILIVFIWAIFKHVEILLALMVFIASLVLFELAHGGLEYFSSWEGLGGIKRKIYLFLQGFLGFIKSITDPFLKYVIPDLGSKMKGKENLNWIQLFIFSMSVPFILGLDDFAGYLPLFSVINVFGFAIGVFSGHTLLNICLFISPQKTINIVKNEWVSLLGTVAFIGLGIFGLSEVIRIILHF